MCSTPSPALPCPDCTPPGALAQPEFPEPAAWRHSSTLSLHDRYEDVEIADGDSFAEPLYTAAQLQQAVEQAQAKREPMTPDDRLKIYKQFACENALGEVGIWADASRFSFIVRAIEAHHNIGGK